MTRRLPKRPARRGPRILPEAPPSEAHLRILDIVRRIPKGRVSTYGRVAALAGLAGRARLVGRILAASPLAAGLPWHRVVNAAGRVSVRSGPGMGEQMKLLAMEGVEVEPGGRIDLAAYLWRPGDSIRKRRAAVS